MIMSFMKDVIVIPTYNERTNIMALVPAIFHLLPAVSVLVVDDNSPDGTAAAVTELTKSFSNLSLWLRPGKAGLGPAYLDGFARALSDPEVRTVTMMDADLSHDPRYLPEMFARSRRFGVVCGSRYVPGGSTQGWELWRRVLSRAGNVYARTVMHLPVRDCTGGFNVIQATFLRQLDFDRFTLRGYAFIMELKYALREAGATFTEVPIVFKNRTAGKSKISNHIIQEGIFSPWKIILRKHFSGGSAGQSSPP